MRALAPWLTVALFSSAWLVARPAAAQDEPAREEAATPPAEEAAETSEAKPSKIENPPADASREDSPFEARGQTYRFLGLRYRGIIVPKFMINLFGDGGRTVYVDAFGPEFAIRKDNFEYIFSVWWADYDMSEKTPFKSSTDPDEGWEHVTTDIDVFYLTADFLWSAPMSESVAFNYGLGAGFGFVSGDVNREQVKPTASSGGDPAKYVPCTLADKGVNPYCDPSDPFTGYKEPSWAHGGSKPIILPWLYAQIGFRFKPHRRFVGRLDAGFGTSGFFLGLGADYGL
jgi:hypothetical protein